MFGPFNTRRCRVHSRELQRGTATISYGLIRFPAHFLIAQRELFPCARTFVLGGCKIGTEKSREVLYCEDCREAELKWRHDNPDFDQRQAVSIAIESQRRELPDSLGKRILRQSELRTPERVRRYEWIIYRIALDESVLYHSRDKTYTFPHGRPNEQMFCDVQELAGHLTDRYS